MLMYSRNLASLHRKVRREFIEKKIREPVLLMTL